MNCKTKNQSKIKRNRGIIDRKKERKKKKSKEKREAKNEKQKAKQNMQFVRPSSI